MKNCLVLILVGVLTLGGCQATIDTTARVRLTEQVERIDEILITIATELHNTNQRIKRLEAKISRDKRHGRLAN